MKSLPAKARTLLFVALSGVAVPACQHFEGGGKPARDQARADLTAPSHVGVADSPLAASLRARRA